MGGICTSGPANRADVINPGEKPIKANCQPASIPPVAETPQEAPAKPEPEEPKPEERPAEPRKDAVPAVAPAAETETEDSVESEESEESEEEYKEIDAEEEDDSDIDDFDSYCREVNPSTLKNADEVKADDFGIAVKSKEAMEEDDLFQTEETDAGVEFMAVKPWLGAIVEPSNAPANDSRLPDYDLKLEWAYGYRCWDSRNNVAVNSEGSILYPTAGVVVKYDSKTHTQEHFQGHNDDIVCLAQNPANPDIIATGQVATIVDGRATLPHICIWNSVTGESWTLKNAHKRAVRAIGFSANGQYLASVGNDNDFTVTVWDWQTGARMASEGGEQMPNNILDLVWRNDAEFCTVGKKHCYFWSFEDGVLEKKRGSLRGKRKQKFKRQTFISVSYTEKGLAAVACRDGSIYFFKDGKAVKGLDAHQRAVMSVHVPEQGGIITAGKQGEIKIWDSGLDVTNTIQFDSPVGTVMTKGSRMIVGTTKGALYDIADYTTQGADEAKAIVKGHYDGELWGLAVNPVQENVIASVGEDNTISIWDTVQHKQLSSASLSTEKHRRRRRRRAGTTSAFAPAQCGRAVTWSPDGLHLAVGTNEGEIIVFTDDLKQVTKKNLNEFGKQNVSNKKENWIQTMQYSPDGRVLAVGTHGMVIVLCNVENGYAAEGVLAAHCASIKHLDWTKDSKHLQSDCGAYELLFHNVEQKLEDSKQEPSATVLKDAEWATQSCVFGWSVQGVFAPDQDGTDVNSVAKSPDGKLLASGDDYGNVNLFRYPALSATNQRRVTIGHASHVMNVGFSGDSKLLYSVGGGDKTILQWSVFDSPAPVEDEEQQE